MVARGSGPRTQERANETLLSNIYRQLVAIHAPLAEAVDADENIRRETLGRVSVLLKYVEQELKKEDGARQD